MTERKKITELLPKSFCPKAAVTKIDCKAHILKFKDYVKYQELERFEDIKDRFRLTLEGTARLWFEEETFDKFETLESAFIKKFAPFETKISVIRKYNLSKLENKQKIDEFAEELKEMAQVLKYSEDQVKNKFLLALPQECQRFITMTDPDGSIENYKTMAKAFLEFDITEKPSDDPTPEQHFYVPTTPLDDVEELKKEIEFLKRKCDSLENRGRTVQRNYNQQGPGNYPQRRKTFFCDYCNGPNHRWQQCRKREADLKSKTNGRAQRNAEEESSSENSGEVQNFQ